MSDSPKFEPSIYSTAAHSLQCTPPSSPWEITAILQMLEDNAKKYHPCNQLELDLHSVTAGCSLIYNPKLLKHHYLTV